MRQQKAGNEKGGGQGTEEIKEDGKRTKENTNK